MQQPRQGRNFEASCSKVNSDVISGRPGQLRHSSRPWAGRSTNIRIECSAATRKPAHHRQRPAFKLDGVPEHEVQERLKFKMLNGRTYLCAGQAWTPRATRGPRDPFDNLTNCEDAIAAFEQATDRSLPPGRRRHRRPAPPSRHHRSRRQVSRSRLRWWAGLCFKALLAARRWTCSVARLCPRGAFSHVVAYKLQPADVRAAWQGGHAPRRHLLQLPLDALTRRPRPRVWPGPSAPGPPDPKFEFQSWSMARHSSWPWAGRSTEIRIECSAVYTLRRVFRDVLSKLAMA